MKKIVVLTGAGISVESGLATFRGAGGLWEGYEIMEVASIEGWHKNPTLVLEFYNKRRSQALKAAPNEGHKILARLQNSFEVVIVTQNVDNLHERAGSENVIHLHGELSKSRSTVDPELVYDIKGNELNPGEVCEKGSQLRPDIVWFGEEVPRMDHAVWQAKNADVFIVVGTSLQVYPAASLVGFVKKDTPVYVVDPEAPEIIRRSPGLRIIQETASIGLGIVYRELMNNISQ